MNGLGSAPSATSSHSKNNTKNGNDSNGLLMGMNASLTTMYDAHEVGMVTLEQKRQREHNLAMKKAEAVTSRYSSVCGLDMTQLPVTVQRHRNSAAAAAAAAAVNNTEQSQRNTSSSASTGSHHHKKSTAKSQSPSRNKLRHNHHIISERGDGNGGEQARRQSGRSSAEPDFLALNASFRKSFSSIASSDLPASAGAEAAGGTPPPPLQTEVTDLMLTPKEEGKRYQQKIKSADRPYDESPYSPALPEGNSTLKSPPPAASRPPQSSSSFHASLYSQPQNHQHLHPDTTTTSGSRVASYPSPESVLADVKSGHHPTDVSLASSKSRTIEDQAQMLREIQEQHQRQQQEQHFTTGVHAAGTDKAKPTAIEEQEALWRELSLQHRRQREQLQQQQQQPQTYQPPYHHHQSASSPAAIFPGTVSSSPLSPQEEQAQLWARIQQQQQHMHVPQVHQQQQLQPSELDSVAGGHNAIPRMTPLEEQAYLLEEIRKRHTAHRNPPPAYPTFGSDMGGATLDYNGMGPAHTGISAVEDQTRMLRALELQQKNARSYLDGMGWTPPVEQPWPSASVPPPMVNPVEQQAARLREIQQEKEERILEMACKMSMLNDSAPSLALSSVSEQNDLKVPETSNNNYNSSNVAGECSHHLRERATTGGDDEEASLRYIMDLSLIEAEAREKAQKDIDRALQVAVERSREDLDGNKAGPRESTGVSADANGDDSASIELETAIGASTESNNDLELRRSIAELALQATSDHDLEVAEPASNSRRRPWGFRYGRK